MKYHFSAMISLVYCFCPSRRFKRREKITKEINETEYCHLNRKKVFPIAILGSDSQTVFCRDRLNCQNSFSNCQNFPFQTVKVSFPNCQKSPFPNCQKKISVCREILEKVWETLQYWKHAIFQKLLEIDCQEKINEKIGKLPNH